MHYFDNAATTFPKPEEVYKFMDTFYRQYGVNVGRGQFKEASIAFAMVQETRELILQLFHVQYPYEVIFTPSATVALNTIIGSFPFKESDNIYVSSFEHNAVLRTLHEYQTKYGFKLYQFPIDSQSLSLDLAGAQKMFAKDKPDYCFISHASNAFGYILPIEDLCQMSKEYGAITIVDMAQTAGLVETYLGSSNIDYAVFAGHKTLYGPLGVGGIITNKAKVLKPYIFGGTGYDSKNMEMPKETPLKFEAGSPNVQAIAGLNAALKWINKIGVNNIRQKEKKLTERLLNILKKHSNINVVRNADENKNIGVIACVFSGYSSDNIGQVLAQKDIAVRTGLHCAPLGHDTLKTAPDGTVRLSVSYFTTDEDILALDKALDYIEIEG